MEQFLCICALFGNTEDLNVVFSQCNFFQTISWTTTINMWEEKTHGWVESVFLVWGGHVCEGDYSLNSR